MKKALILLIALSLSFLLAGCGSNPHEGSSNGELGAIAFQLSWDTSSAISKEIKALPEGADVCTYYQIDTINFTVANASGQPVATGSWPCSAHSGTISNVPVGTMSVTIEGVVGGVVVWRGQATGINVVAGQTANAGTIGMSYVGSDSIAPTVQPVNPANGATGVPLNASVSAIFSEPVVIASVNPSTFTLTCGTTTVTGTVAYDSPTQTATFTPDAPLPAASNCTATITTGVEDLAGHQLASNYSWSFTVSTATAKDITGFSFTSPAATGMIDQTAKSIFVNVPSGTNVTALVATFTTTGQSVTVGGTVQVSGATSNNFTSPVTYTVTAADGSIQNYTVTVRVGALPAQWARTVTAGSSDSVFNSISVASDGSVYAAGVITGTSTYNFGNNIMSTAYSTSYNTVLVKYNSSGLALWARTVTAAASDVSEFNSVSVASDGSVYAAGRITGTSTYNFGNSVTAAGTNSSHNIVLVKYNSSGLAQWAQTVTAGSSDSVFNSVSVASDGSVYAAGYITGPGTYNFGNSITAAGTYSTLNILLVKYNSSGLAQWAQTVTAGSFPSHFDSVSVASDGSVYAAGYINGTGTYNFGNSVTAAGTYAGQNIVLVKYNSIGVAQWAQSVTAGSSASNFNSVSVASDGSVYAAGSISGTSTHNFGNSVTAAGANSSYNTVLVKYNGSGTAQWAQSVTAGSSNSYFYSASAASDGSVYAAGYIALAGTYNFGNNVTVAGTYISGWNIVLVKYNSSGLAQWAQTVTAGSNNSYFSSVSMASDGSVYAAGAIIGTGTYGFGNSITAAGTYSIFNILLVKYY